jgi:ribonuclease HI
MVRLYTDGSCLGNPGKGGWGAIGLNENDEILFRLSGGAERETNNTMELTAVIRGLERIRELGMTDVIVYTDSKYVSQGISVWIAQWIRKNWKKSDGKPVKNKELWVKLYEICLKIDHIQWEWVKAHSGNKWNEEVDSLARNFAENI